jgi:immunoglobulin-binding protein 1
MSDAESASDQSLSSTFRTAEDLREQVNSGAIPTATAIPQLVTLYSQCAKLISSLSLFSPNESLDDISSSELQYLLVDYFLADALFRKGIPVAQERKETVLEARSIWERFMRRLDQYDMFRKEDARMWERYLENKNGFEVAGGLDASQRRDVKITRFREEKELKRKLEV